MTRRTARPHRQRLDLSPAALARQIDTMEEWALEDHANAILGRFTLTAEAPGMRIAQDTLAHTKPGATAPRSIPMCDCGCPSQRDHADRSFKRARILDAAHADARAVPNTHRKLRIAVVIAAQDLERATKGPGSRIHAAGVELTHEREQYICDEYEGMDPDLAAAMEANRPGNGHCTEEAIRACRRRNDRHPETGAMVEAKPQPLLQERARTMRAAGKKQGEIADAIGVAQSTVSRWQQKDDDGQRSAA